MSCGSACGCGSNKVVLNENNLDAEILAAVSKLKKGDEVFLSCKTDFTQNLISVMNANFPNSKIKAIVAEESESETLIHMVYPESEESCCGFCS